MNFAVSRRLPLIAGVVCLSLALAALGLAGRSASADTTVEAGNDYFCSSSFDGAVCETDITAGDTVTWNVVAGSHTVTQCSDGYAACPPAGGFDSGILVEGDTYSHTYTEPGTYPYRCELHTSEMLGTIVVAAAATPSPTPSPSVTVAPTDAPVTPTAATLPKTGGKPDDDNSPVGLWYRVLAFGSLAIAAAAFAVARGRDRE